MTPAYKKEDGWYFQTSQGEEGPYNGQLEAEQAWRVFLLEKKACPTGTCED